MTRWYQLFETVEERKAWEEEQKKENEKFYVCFRTTTTQLVKDGIYIDETTKENYKYATIYTFKK